MSIPMFIPEDIAGKRFLKLEVVVENAIVSLAMV